LEKHHVYVLTRHPKKHPDTEFVSYISFKYPMKKLPFIHAIVNLAGESLFGYWSKEKKHRILKSRLETTERLTNILMHMDLKPNVFISGSAVGYYGAANETIFTEATDEPANDFLATVCATWEEAASVAKDLGIRTVFTRFGIVLDSKLGALPMMALPVKCGVGGRIGNGKQWMSWIHIDDCVNLLMFALYEQKIKGALNMTAPYPKTNDGFMKDLAKTMKRPALIPMPTTFFKVALGEMHQLITAGQYVYPQKALDNGFIFQFPQLDEALQELYR
jgi:uncharacterized protein (TIGR01777 family)